MRVRARPAAPTSRTGSARSCSPRAGRPAAGGLRVPQQEAEMITRFVCIVLANCVLLARGQQMPSPAQASMQKAQEQIAKHPGHYPYYNELAMACARRARETSDAAWYGKAEEALKGSFAIAPDNFEGLKVWTWLLL